MGLEGVKMADSTVINLASIPPETARLLIIGAATALSVGIVAAAAAFITVGLAAFRSGSHPNGPESFGLLMRAFPAVTTIVLIVIATATLTAMGILNASACVAIFSSVASFVLGAESQKRKDAPDQLDGKATPPTLKS
jgi:hypothetical protein